MTTNAMPIGINDPSRSSQPERHTYEGKGGRGALPKSLWFSLVLDAGGEATHVCELGQ